MHSLKKDPARQFIGLLALITVTGFLLRLKGLASESITADEADTLYRIRESGSLRELLDVWVRHDGHPPFIHLLEYFWTALFGISEGAVRFPFALMGAGAIWYAGKIAAKWFGNNAGIATAAGVAFLQFPLMYSQLARPYSPGLFFSMALTWYWSCWVLADKPQRKHLILFVVMAAGAFYSHYFSLLFAGLVGFAGFFFLRKKMVLPYLLAGVSIVILFLPYIGIFFYQLGVGGVGGTGGWLATPTPAFVADHIWFIFDTSRIILFGALALSVFTLLFFFKRPTKFHLLALFLWLMPLLIGYFYSVKSNPVLQNSVLLFSFPFFLMLLFSWIPSGEKERTGQLLAAGFAFVLLGYVTVYKPFHLTNHFGRLRELVETTTELQSRYGSKNVDVIYNVDIPYFIEYNYQQLNKTAAGILTTANSGGKELLELRSMVQNSQAEFFVYGWSTKYSSPEILAIIREKFPFPVEEKCWFNSAVYCFTKRGDVANDKSNEIIFQSVNDFNDKYHATDSFRIHQIPAEWSEPCKVEWKQEHAQPKLTAEDSARKDSLFKTDGPYTYIWQLPDNVIRLDSTCIYSPMLKIKAGDILKNPDNEILFTVNMKLLDTAAVAVLVIQIDRDGKQLYWNGIESDTQIEKGATDFQNVYFGLRLPKDLRSTDTVSFLCYTKDGKRVLIDYLDVKTLKGHPGIYGPRADFN
jgi:hypothetical protein